MKPRERLTLVIEPMQPLRQYEVAVTINLPVDARNEAAALNFVKELLGWEPDQMTARRIS